jgi:geranylgeranyl diphosphate synthase type II
MTECGVASLDEYLLARRAEIDEALRLVLPAAPACPSVIAESMRYSLFAGGKRFRPVLTLAAAEAVAGDRPDVRRAAMPAACAVEIIHTYSLIHDDLPAMDNDTMRRGKPTLHVVYGEGMAILAGDGLLTEAFALLARTPEADGATACTARTLAVMARLAHAAGAAGMVGGQAIDLHAVGHGHDGVLTVDDLRDMHARKTGALIRAAAVAGCITAGGTATHIAAVDAYAAGLGLAFQIVDDILDVEGAGHDLGKTVGKDAAANKPTYPAYFGVGESKRMARAATDGALAALRRAGLHQSRLADIAAWVISRTS